MNHQRRLGQLRRERSVRPSLTDEEAAEVRARYQAGLSERYLAERFQVSRATIRRALDAETVDRRPTGARRQLDDSIDQEILDLAAAGYSWREIGAKLGIHHTTAYRRAHRPGVSAR